MTKSFRIDSHSYQAKFENEPFARGSLRHAFKGVLQAQTRFGRRGGPLNERRIVVKVCRSHAFVSPNFTFRH